MSGSPTEAENPAAHGDERPAKAPGAFRTISEVAAELGVPPHVLRFWETRFSLLRPLKRGGGRRYYRPEDVELLRTIRRLLYEEGYTIKGAQKALRSIHSGARGGRGEDERSSPARTSAALQLGGEARSRLLAIRDELDSLRALLQRALT